MKKINKSEQEMMKAYEEYLERQVYRKEPIIPLPEKKQKKIIEKKQ